MLAAALAVDPLQLLHLPNGIDLKALRLLAGRTELQVAQSAHVAPASYLKWESGRSLPSKNQRIIEAPAQGLSVSTAQIRAALKALFKMMACSATKPNNPISSGRRNSAPPSPMSPPRTPTPAPATNAGAALTRARLLTGRASGPPAGSAAGMNATLASRRKPTVVDGVWCPP